MEQWCRSVVKYGAYRSVTESGQAIKLFQAPRKIILGLPSIFYHKSFISDDVKRAELSIE